MHRCFREKVCAAAAAAAAAVAVCSATVEEDGRRAYHPQRTPLFTESEISGALALVDSTRMALESEVAETEAGIVVALRAQDSERRIRRAAVKRSANATEAALALAAAISNAAAAVCSSSARAAPRKLQEGKYGAVACSSSDSSDDSDSCGYTSCSSDCAESVSTAASVHSHQLSLETRAVRDLLLRHYRLQWESDECAADFEFLKVCVDFVFGFL